MTDMTNAEDLKLWAKDEADPLIKEGYLMAAKTIENLEKQLNRHKRFVAGIKPYLEQEGYHGFVENINELQKTA